GGGFICGAVSAIDDNPQAFQGHLARQRTFRVFDVAAQGVVDADRFADLTRSGPDVFDLAAEHQLFDLRLDIVIELVTIRAEKLNAVITVRIVRRGDD